MASDENPLEEMELNVDELESLSALFQAFSQKTRLGILLGLYYGFSPPEIADAVDVSRPGLQTHLQQMRERRLIRRNESGSYVLTPLGTYFAEWIEQHRDRILNTVEYVEQEETAVAEEIAETVNPENISDWEQVVAAELWERAAKPVSDQLGLDREPVADIDTDEPALPEKILEADPEELESFTLSEDSKYEFEDALKERGIIDEAYEDDQLYNYIDLDALEAIFESDDEKQRRGLVAFEYQGDLIVVSLGEQNVDEVSPDEVAESDDAEE